jgi:hypothetical protein
MRNLSGMSNMDNLKSIFLSESLEETMDEMAYPDSWSWDTFKALKNYNQRIKYCEQHLRRLGSGSGRIAFQVDNDKILKIAKNQKGVAQNDVEIQLFFDGYIVNSGYQNLLAKVYEADEENGLWLEMDLLSQIKLTEFKEYFGVSIRELDNVIRAIEDNAGKNRWYGRHTSELFDKFNEGELEESNPKLYELIDLLQEMSVNFDHAIGDMKRISSYGRTVDGRIVVVDYGLSWDVWSEFYDGSRK